MQLKVVLKPVPENRLRGAYPHLPCTFVAHLHLQVFTIPHLSKVLITSGKVEYDMPQLETYSPMLL
jgi:hypothetical protein